MEIWKDVKGYEGLYKVSNKGNILIVRKKRNQNLLKANNGYLLVDLYKNGIKNRISAHRLVAIHFLINSENKPQVNHINGIKFDNRAENLEWVTASENQLHSVNTGLKKIVFGENCKYSKITENQALEIKYGYKDFLQKDIAKIYNISRTTVIDIRKGRSWKHI
jgi:hypothetical protein